MKTNNITREVINILLDGNDPNLLPQLSDEFSKAAAESKRENSIIITTAVSLLEEEKKDFANRINKIFLKRFTNVETKIDQSILGGIKIQIGDVLIDASIQSQLKRLKNFLSS